MLERRADHDSLAHAVQQRKGSGDDTARRVDGRQARLDRFRVLLDVPDEIGRLLQIRGHLLQLRAHDEQVDRQARDKCHDVDNRPQC